MRRIFVIICVLISILSFSQDKVELLNKGNEYFQEEDFEKAEEYYKKSLEVDNQYYKANLNTGHSLFRQAFSLIQEQDTTGLKECLESSELFYRSSLEVTTNKNEKSESLYNLGNAQLLSQNLEESIESYKKSLRLVPENMNAKHNLALAQYLLNKKQKNQENQEDSKQEDKEKKKDQNQEDKQKEKEEKKESLSKEEIEQILNALEREEKEVQEDLQKKKIIGGNKLLKDW
ncbi:MAG: tetratricopeptide repeat protein [Flavobacteriales bacterium]|nr:tetratricopeptide repeat protein [Flavobacteriales bacterium]